MSGPDRDDTDALASDGHHLTDVGNSERLIEVADGKLRYVHAWGKWLVYRGGRWVIDEKDALVTEFAKRVPQRMMRAQINDKHQRSLEVKYALKSESAGAIAAMVHLARGTPGNIVDHEELDADPYLLNVKNGTIDLRSGKLRDHDPADLLTLQSPIAYDPEATAPLWEACLERWQPDPAIRRYLQVRAGASATGIATETLDLDIGDGGNGKSKFHGAVRHVLGPYEVVPHKSLLVAYRHEQHATVKASLFRKRLAVAGETGKADKLDEEQVKALTGGDRIGARRMKEDEWWFDPSYTLILFSNYRPRIAGTDEAIWRRVRLVEWLVTIPEGERDPDLADKLKAEGVGILRWVVEGAVVFLSEGLTVPDSVRVATSGYRQSQNVVARFVADRLRIRDAEVASADIADALEAWCAEEGIKGVPRMNDVATVLERHGCQKSRSRRNGNGKLLTVWSGVCLSEDADEQAEHSAVSPCSPSAGYPVGNGLARSEPEQGDQGDHQGTEILRLGPFPEAEVLT